MQETIGTPELQKNAQKAQQYLDSLNLKIYMNLTSEKDLNFLDDLMLYVD